MHGDPALAWIQGPSFSADQPIQQAVENDATLLADLFGELLPQYLLTVKDPVYWSQDLERESEVIKLVEA